MKSSQSRSSCGVLLLAALENCQPAAPSPEERLPNLPGDRDLPCRAAQYPILYESPRGSDGLDAHVFSMKADGSDATQIGSQGDFYGAVWSPEGRRIAFRRRVWLAGQSEPGSEIGLMTADGTEQVSLIVDEHTGNTALVHERRDGPSFAPDGLSLAFASREDAEPWAIWLMPASGGAPQRLMPELESTHYDVAWSPIALDELVYVADTDGVSDLWRFHRSHALRENLTHGRVSDPHSPRFSPDGGRLVFSASRAADAALATRDRDLFVLDLSSGEITALTHDPANDFGPVWSPDGGSVLFARIPESAEQRAASQQDLWRVTVDSPASLRRVTQDVTAHFAPDWYPHASCGGLSNQERGASQ